MKEYLLRVIASFEQDPPDSPYQEGYLEAFQEMLRMYEELTGDDNAQVH